MENVDIIQDIHDFILENKTDKEFYSKEFFKPYQSFLNKTLGNNDSNLDNINSLETKEIEKSIDFTILMLINLYRLY